MLLGKRAYCTRRHYCRSHGCCRRCRAPLFLRILARAAVALRIVLLLALHALPPAPRTQWRQRRVEHQIQQLLVVLSTIRDGGSRHDGRHDGRHDRRNDAAPPGDVRGWVNGIPTFPLTFPRIPCRVPPARILVVAVARCGIVHGEPSRCKDRGGCPARLRCLALLPCPPRFPRPLMRFPLNLEVNRVARQPPQHTAQSLLLVSPSHSPSTAPSFSRTITAQLQALAAVVVSLALRRFKVLDQRTVAHVARCEGRATHLYRGIGDCRAW